MNETGTERVDRWAAVRDRQRDAIAQGAIRAAAEQAGGQLSVASVAAAAGMARKTFYKYFDSLDAAMSYASEVVWREMMGLDQAEEVQAPNGREHFLALHQRMMGAALRRPELVRFQAYVDHAYRPAARPAGARTLYAGANERMWLEVERVFREGQADGSIRVDLDPRVTITAVGIGTAGLVQRLFNLDWIFDVDSAAVFTAVMEAWRRYLSPGEALQVVR